MRLVSPNFKDIFEPNIEIGAFPDGDSNINVLDISACKGCEVTLFHRLYPRQNDTIIELLFILNALKKANAKVTVVAPYLPYARQDKVFLSGEVASAEVVCNLLHEAGCQKLITFDCHFLKKEGEFPYGNLMIKNISLNKELLGCAEAMAKGEKCEIVAPDVGASYLVESQDGKTMKKKRKLYKDGKITYRHIEKMEYQFDVKDKNIVILDDMISTGSTMIKAIECMKKGGAKRVFCAATHGFFLHDSLDKLKSLSDGVFVSDTIPSPVSKVSIAEKCKEL